MHQFAHYEHLAVLFDYPRRDYPTWVQSIYDLLAGRYLLAAAHIDAFAKALPTDGGPFDPEALDEVQEVFTRSFDVQSIGDCNPVARDTAHQLASGAWKTRPGISLSGAPCAPPELP